MIDRPLGQPLLGLRSRRVTLDDVVDELPGGGLAALQEPQAGQHGREVGTPDA